MASRSNSSGIGIILVGIIGYFAYKKFVRPDILVPLQTKQYVEQMRAEIKNVKMQKGNVQFDIVIENPNPKPMTVDAVVGDIYLFSNDGKTQYKLGNVANYPKLLIKPDANTNVAVSVKINGIQLLNYFDDLLAGKIKGQIITFNGTVNADKRTWPIKESVQIA